MVDRESRIKAWNILDAMLHDGITNYKLEDEWPDQSPDFSLGAIGEQLWFYYADFPEKKLTRVNFEPDTIKLIERCMVFLTSERDYEWPQYSFVTENRILVERLLGLGKQRSAEQWEQFKAAGEIDAWPFLRLSDYQEETKKMAS